MGGMSASAETDCAASSSRGWIAAGVIGFAAVAGVAADKAFSQTPSPNVQVFAANAEEGGEPGNFVFNITDALSFDAQIHFVFTGTVDSGDYTLSPGDGITSGTLDVSEASTGLFIVPAGTAQAILTLTANPDDANTTNETLEIVVDTITFDENNDGSFSDNTAHPAGDQATATLIDDNRPGFSLSAPTRAVVSEAAVAETSEVIFEFVNLTPGNSADTNTIHLQLEDPARDNLAFARWNDDRLNTNSRNEDYRLDIAYRDNSGTMQTVTHSENSQNSRNSQNPLRFDLPGDINNAVITVTPIDDSVHEVPETIFIEIAEVHFASLPTELSGVSYCVSGTGVTVCTPVNVSRDIGITDNDAEPSHGARATFTFGSGVITGNLSASVFLSSGRTHRFVRDGNPLGSNAIVSTDAFRVTVTNASSDDLQGKSLRPRYRLINGPNTQTASAPQTFDSADYLVLLVRTNGEFVDRALTVTNVEGPENTLAQNAGSISGDEHEFPLGILALPITSDKSFAIEIYEIQFGTFPGGESIGNFIHDQTIPSIIPDEPYRLHVTIVDDEASRTFATQIEPVRTFPLQLDEGADVAVRVTLDNPADEGVILPYTITGIDGADIEDGDADSDGDPLTGGLAIDYGLEYAELIITTVADGLFEGDERMTVTFESDTDGVPTFPIGIKRVVTVSIMDGDPLPVPTELVGFSIPDGSSPLAEDGDSVVVTATLDHPVPHSDLPVSIPYTLAGADVTADDFSSHAVLSGVITIAAGAIKGTATIISVDDTLAERDETVTVAPGTLPNNSAGDQLTTSLGDITFVITDDEAGTVSLTGTAGPFTEAAAVTAGGLTFTITLNGKAPAGAVFPYTITGVTLGDDYMAPTVSSPPGASIDANNITIPVGETEVMINVAIVDDNIEENDETLVFILTAGAYAGVTVPDDALHRVVITGEIGPPPVLIPGAAYDSTASITLNDLAAASTERVLTLTNAPLHDATVKFTFTGGTADDTTVINPNPSFPITNPDIVFSVNGGGESLVIDDDGTTGTFTIPAGTISAILTFADGYDVDTMNEEVTFTITDIAFDDGTDDTDISALPALTINISETVNICDRTDEVEAAIFATRAVSLASNLCDRISTRQMSIITTLENVGSISSRTLKVGDFANLPRLGELNLDATGLNSLPPTVFDGLSSLTELNLLANALESLPARLFDGLSSLQDLDLGVNSLASLPPTVFDGLSSLTRLNLGTNNLESLPARLFDGLSKLKMLFLDNNRLTSLDENLFDGLDDLVLLNLILNRNLALPVGLFNDVLDMLTTLDLDNALKATVSIGLRAAVIMPGSSHDLTVQLTTSLPADVHLTITSSGTAESSLTPSDTVIIPAGMTTANIVFNAGATVGSTGTVVLSNPRIAYTDTLGQLQTTNQAGVLNSLVNTLNPDSNTFAFSVSNDADTLVNICGRTDKVRTAIRATRPVTEMDCRRVPQAQLDLITVLVINNLDTVKNGDFANLPNLDDLNLVDGNLASLTAGVFDGLPNLTKLRLGVNSLASLPATVFNGLPNLTRLNLGTNELDSLPAGLFDGLFKLESLFLDRNNLTLPLPAGLFNDVLGTLTELTLNDQENNADLRSTVSIEPVTTTIAPNTTRTFTARLTPPSPAGVRLTIIAGGNQGGNVTLPDPATVTIRAGERTADFDITLAGENDDLGSTGIVVIEDVSALVYTDRNDMEQENTVAEIAQRLVNVTGGGSSTSTFTVADVPTVEFTRDMESVDEPEGEDTLIIQFDYTISNIPANNSTFLAVRFGTLGPDDVPIPVPPTPQPPPPLVNGEVRFPNATTIEYRYRPGFYFPDTFSGNIQYQISADDNTTDDDFNVGITSVELSGSGDVITIPGEDIQVRGGRRVTVGGTTYAVQTIRIIDAQTPPEATLTRDRASVTEGTPDSSATFTLALSNAPNGISTVTSTITISGDNPHENDITSVSDGSVDTLSITYDGNISRTGSIEEGGGSGFFTINITNRAAEFTLNITPRNDGDRRFGNNTDDDSTNEIVTFTIISIEFPGSIPLVSRDIMCINCDSPGALSITIIDDDAEPSAVPAAAYDSTADVTITEDGGPAASAERTLTLTDAPGAADVAFTFSGGTASAGTESDINLSVSGGENLSLNADGTAGAFTIPADTQAATLTFTANPDSDSNSERITFTVTGITFDNDAVVPELPGPLTIRITDPTRSVMTVTVSDPTIAVGEMTTVTFALSNFPVLVGGIDVVRTEFSFRGFPPQGEFNPPSNSGGATTTTSGDYDLAFSGDFTTWGIRGASGELVLNVPVSALRDDAAANIVMTVTAKAASMLTATHSRTRSFGARNSPLRTHEYDQTPSLQFTITEALVPPTARFSATDPDASELNNDPAVATLTLMNADAAGGATVSFELSSDDAIFGVRSGDGFDPATGADYLLDVILPDDSRISLPSSSSGTFILPAIEREVRFWITPIADDADETTQNVVVAVTRVDFSSGSALPITTRSAVTLRIADYGPLPTAQLSLDGNSQINEGGNTGVFTLRLDNAPNGNDIAVVAYSLTVTGGANPANDDITAEFGLAAAGNTPVIGGTGWTFTMDVANRTAIATLTIASSADDDDDDEETVRFTVTGITFTDTGTGTDITDESFRTLTIIDDDPEIFSVNFSPNRSIYGENEDIVISITLDGPLPVAGMVHYQILPGNSGAAIAAHDVSSDLNFGDSGNNVHRVSPGVLGVQLIEFPVHVTDDNRVEPDEERGIFRFVSITWGTHTAGSPGNLDFTITDNDGITLELNSDGYDVRDNAGALDVAVIATPNPFPDTHNGVILDRAVAATLASTDGSAMAPDDYTTVNETLIYDAGSSLDDRTTVSITINGDEDSVEETFTLDLEKDDRAVTLVAPDAATVTIIPNTSASYAPGTDTDFTLIEGGASTGRTLTLVNAPNAIATVSFEFRGGMVAGGRAADPSLALTVGADPTTPTINPGGTGGSFTIPPGVDNFLLTFAPREDNNDLSETIRFTINSITFADGNVADLGALSVLVIEVTDTAASLDSRLIAVHPMGSEVNNTPATATLTLVGPDVSGEATASFALSGSATFGTRSDGGGFEPADADYLLDIIPADAVTATTGGTGTLALPSTDGERQVHFRITPIADAADADSGDEEVEITVSNITLGNTTLPNRTATLDIADYGPLPTADLALSDNSVPEGGSDGVFSLGLKNAPVGTGIAEVTYDLTIEGDNVADDDITAAFGGAASAGATAAVGTRNTFRMDVGNSNSVSTATLTITTADDDADTTDETVIFTVTGITFTDIGTGTDIENRFIYPANRQMFDIIDDDPATATATIASSEVDENLDIEVTVRLDKPLPENGTVRYTIRPRPAASGAGIAEHDVSAVHNFGAGNDNVHAASASADNPVITFLVDVADDNRIEPDREGGIISIASVVWGSHTLVVDADLSFTIADNDGITLTLAAAEHRVRDNVGTLSVAVNAAPNPSPSTDAGVILDRAVTATLAGSGAGGDYTVVNPSLNYAVNGTARGNIPPEIITVRIRDDGDTADQTFVLTLASGDRAVSFDAPDAATVTIVPNASARYVNTAAITIIEGDALASEEQRILMIEHAPPTGATIMFTFAGGAEGDSFDFSVRNGMLVINPDGRMGGNIRITAGTTEVPLVFRAVNDDGNTDTERITFTIIRITFDDPGTVTDIAGNNRLRIIIRDADSSASLRLRIRTFLEGALQ